MHRGGNHAIFAEHCPNGLAPRCQLGKSTKDPVLWRDSSLVCAVAASFKANCSVLTGSKTPSRKACQTRSALWLSKALVEAAQIEASARINSQPVKATSSQYRKGKT